MTRGIRRGVSILISLGMLLVALYGMFLGIKLVFRWLYPMNYVQYVEKYADENGLEYGFVYAVIKAESGFDPQAVSSAGAKGLMQLTPDTFSWLQTKTGETLPEENLFDPETNIRYGTLLLGILQERYGEEAEMLCGYHAGMGITGTWLDDPGLSQNGETLDYIPYGDTRNYVSRVKENIKIYHWLYEFEDGGQKQHEKIRQ